MQGEYLHTEIAEMIGCSVSVVNNIATGNNWKQIYNKYELWKYRKSKSEIGLLKVQRLSKAKSDEDENKVS